MLCSSRVLSFSFETYSFATSFCLILCIYLYVFSRLFAFLRLGEVALFCPTDPSNTLHSGHSCGLRSSRVGLSCLWIFLGRHRIGCSACGVRLGKPAWWAGLGPSINKLEREFQHDVCQCQCLYDRIASPKHLPPASVSSGGVPLTCCFSERLFKVSKWV